MPLSSSPHPRRIGAVNWIGLWTLYVKEVRRFLVLPVQTIAAPMVTTLLFLTVFSLALERGGQSMGGVPFLEFLAPGLIVMAMAQNAFANTSSSLITSKLQGNIVDHLMPPLSPLELALGYIGAGITRGLVVGVAAGIALLPLLSLHVTSWGLVLFYGLASSMMLASLGMIGGIWADKFDHIAAVTNFVITPLTFLSGTFYSIDRLPEDWRVLVHLNPFYYMIDGFRAGFTGQSGSALETGILVMLGMNALLGALTWKLLASGYKLKS